ncbi:SLBB domain protein [Leptospira ryugenii]|uniref:SLBB domain protein n=1 Tax=Leptospira ryugenii TaxID=1917863 RepID=A0A2P2E0Z5_9LEPT|nr:SLBB domain-containing protein [Leptospira ryugenii]GBF50555.1 SLBB domain protein [Leptospira ryugenii]
MFLKITKYLVAGLIVSCFAFYLKEHPEIRNHIYTPEMIEVSIKGPVKHPGVYNLESGSTGRDLIEKAGGLLPGASVKIEENGLNQLLVDGQALDLGKR